MKVQRGERSEARDADRPCYVLYFSLAPPSKNLHPKIKGRRKTDHKIDKTNTVTNIERMPASSSRSIVAAVAMDSKTQTAVIFIGGR